MKKSHRFFYTAFLALNFLILLIRMLSILWVWGNTFTLEISFLLSGGKRRIRVLFSFKYWFLFFFFSLTDSQVTLIQNNLYAIVAYLGVACSQSQQLSVQNPFWVLFRFSVSLLVFPFCSHIVFLTFSTLSVL